MNQITTVIWSALSLPLLIGLGGVHSLNLEDYFGSAMAFATSIGMSLILGVLLRGIYVNWYDQKRSSRKARTEFAEMVIFSILFVGTIVSVPSALYCFYNPKNYAFDTTCFISMLGTLYLYRAYKVTRNSRF